LDVAAGTNRPLAEIQPSKPIPLDPLVGDGGRNASWREQQLAKQAAEQRAREQERERLKGGLYRLLLNQDAPRNR
jgi:hypothetical protein